MRRNLPGIVAALLVIWLFPGSQDLSTAWRTAWSAGSGGIATRSADESIALGPVREDVATHSDSEAVPDPFRTEERPPAARMPGSRTGLGVPPPPRAWQVTGRVGERAAVLANPDGRVLVVSVGSAVDSSRVVSIGSSGVVLEDRAGQFTLKIP
ncbi:MAG TPA: hypothetical protein VN931_07605 [Fibrobacteria bacterium]|nr:hypothetical protein [Fibrobacteria bacterium]